MKKFLAMVLSILLILTFTACSKKNETNNSNVSDVSQVTSSNTNSNTNSSKNNDVSSNNKFNNTSNNSSSYSQSNNKNNSSVRSTNNNSSQNNTATSSKENVTSKTEYKNIDNGVLEKATSQEMNVPENMKLLKTNNVKEENNSKNVSATVASYELDGSVVNWTTEKDLIYVITSGNNRLVVINSKTMIPIANVPLAGKPAEMNFIGNELYISLPDLCRIDIFSKSSFAKTSSIYFEHEVSSFCVDGNVIYYSEHDQHCEVFRRNMTTNELTRISFEKINYFYQPKLYLNKQDNILYIGETGITGSTLYYCDATTLELKSIFKKNDYGIMNHTREIFHVGDEIFWGNYRISDTNARQIVGRYGEVDYGSVNFVSKELVSTYEGIFLTDTYECVVNYFDAGFKFENILVTESYNIFFRKRGYNANIIIGVNFNMQ